MLKTDRERGKEKQPVDHDALALFPEEDGTTARTESQQALAATFRPVGPFHRMDLQVAIDSRVNRWKEVLFTEAGEQPEALQLVLNWIFQFAEAQLNTRLP